ncbi:3483_t:CDS:2, partial [Racocetra fulgida]
MENLKKAQLTVIERDSLPASDIYSEADESNEINDDSKEHCLPNENEWRLVKELINIFELFDETTKVFSTKKYPTLLIVYPIIKFLKFKFATDLNLSLIEANIEEYASDINSNSERDEDSNIQPSKALHIQSMILE